MESIKKTVENVERRFGEALGSRDTALTLSGKKPGLGPPDMCWLQKRVKKAFRKRLEVRGSYHWVLGKDMSGELSAAEYLTAMVNGLEKPGFLQGLVPREYSIERGVYCCNDPFGLVDIWCDVETGGKMMARAIDSQGDICEVTPNMWRGARLGCFLRSELYDSATTMSMVKHIRRIELFQTQQAEEDFMDSTLQLYKDGVIQENLHRLQWDKGEGLDPEDLDIVAGTILHYFRRSQRWQKALQFFTRLQEIYPPAAVYLAGVYRELDNPDGAMTVLKTCVEDRGHTDPCLLIAYGNELLQTGNVPEAFEMAKKSIGKAQTARPAWVLLQACFSAKRDFNLSLKTLNFMPGPAMPPHDKDLLFPMLPPKPKSVTKPNQQQYSPDATEFRKLAYEMKHFPYEQVDSLPAEILAPEQYGNSAILGHCAPMYCTRAAARKAYRILLNIVREVGWEEFIEMRSQLFTAADVSLQGHTSVLSKARESINLAAQGDTVHVHLKTTVLENHMFGDNVLNEKLISVSLEVSCPKNLPTSMPSSPSSLSTTKISVLSTTQAENESNNPPSEHTKDLNSLNEKDSAVENNIREEDETMMGDHDPGIANGAVPTVQGEGIQENTSESVGFTDKVSKEFENQHDTPPKPPAKTTLLPKRAFESAEYVEKLKAREGNLDENTTPRPSEVVTPRLTSKILQDNRKDTPVPPASPMSSKGSQAAGTSENGDKWLVRVVSHGIKDRVRYFESIASKRYPEEESKIPDEKEEAAVRCLKPVSSRKGTSMTMMEFFTAGWDESTVAGSEDPALLTGGSTVAEGSEADGSVEEEIAPEDGTNDDTASQLVVKKGWLSVDWSSRSNLNSDRRQTSQSSVGDILREDSQPTSPLIEEAQTQGLESAPVQENDHSDDSDGLWIVHVLEELQECKCSDWLDEIILALWEDLAMYTELRKIDRKWKARSGKAQAEIILGTEEENYSLGSEDDTPRRNQEASVTSSSVTLPKSTSGDWMRRGMLCERLERIPEAEQAYRVCLFKSFNLTALLGLSRIYSSWGWSKEAMQVLNRLAEYHDRCHDFGRDPYIPQSIARAISQLVTSVGNMEVRSCAARCHPMVKFAVDNILNWQRGGNLERRGSQQRS